MEFIQESIKILVSFIDFAAFEVIKEQTIKLLDFEITSKPRVIANRSIDLLVKAAFAFGFHYFLANFGSSFSLVTLFVVHFIDLMILISIIMKLDLRECFGFHQLAFGKIIEYLRFAIIR